jgi:hypothetical protein
MLRRGFFVIISTILTVGISFINPVIVSSQNSGKVSIINDTRASFQLLTCKDNQQVGESILPVVINASNTTILSSHFLNSSDFDSQIDFYLLPTTSEVVQYRFESCNFPLRRPNLTLSLNTSTQVELVINGELSTNGIIKTLPTFVPDNTFHPLDIDVAYFYDKEDPNNLVNQLYKPQKTGIVYISPSKMLNYVCINSFLRSPDEMLSINYKGKVVNISFFQLPEGDYSISPSILSTCLGFITKQQVSVSIYENQYVTIENGAILNPLYRESGVTLYKRVDRNNVL